MFGDRHAHQSPWLTALALVWFRYHNHLARKIQKANPDWRDEKIYRKARRQVVATLQVKLMFDFFFFFSTGLVRLYIAGLPLRSCRTIGAPSVQRSAQCAFFPFLVAAGFEPTSLSLRDGRFNPYPILTPQFCLC